MQRLLEQPHLLLEGRITFRRGWVLRNAPKKPRPARTDWELDYDDNYNFAHMGARHIDDDDWGKPKTKKPKAKRFSDFLKRDFIEGTAQAMNGNAA
jgi:hypothetical protein